MYCIIWKLLIICCAVIAIEGGVKIEITRVKEPPKPLSIAQTVDFDKTTQNEADAIETTTVMTTTEIPTTSATTTEKPSIDSNIQRLTNLTLSSPSNTSEATTINPPNATELNQTAQANTSILVNNVTFPYATDLKPFLSEFTRRQMRRKLIPQDYYCPCDLKINFCDINCCCDVDCATKEIIQTLKCAERDWSIHDYEESSELQLCSQTRQFSLFCVVDNTRKRKESKKRDFAVQRVNIMSVVQYKWPNQFDQKAVSQSDYRENYAFGDSILAWDESNDEIQSFDVPWSFSGSNCRIKMAVKHLVDDETYCTQTIDEHDQFISDFQSKLKSIRILKFRKPMDTSPLVMADFCKFATSSNETENCTRADMYHCIGTISLRTCKQDSNSTTSSMPEFGENFITDEMSIQIHHNFTHISNVTVFFVYHEVSSDNPTVHVLQKISLEYLELNETFATRDVHQVSGNIGYLLHKPVIVSKLIRQPQSIDINAKILTLLSYFHNETNCTNDGHYLKLPAIEKTGDCVINNHTFQTINFGEKTHIACNVILVPNDSNDTDVSDHATMNLERNHTNICRAFQRKIFDYLLYDFELENVNATTYSRFNIRISEMGNPRNDTEHWIDVITVRPPNLNEIIAIGGTNDGSEFTCTNMILGVRYEFFYGTMLVGKISNQALIKLAQIQYGNRLNLKFKLDDDVLKVPIYTDVMFYDFSRVATNRAHEHIQSHFICILIILLWNMRHFFK